MRRSGPALIWSKNGGSADFKIERSLDSEAGRTLRPEIEFGFIVSSHKCGQIVACHIHLSHLQVPSTWHCREKHETCDMRRET